MLLPLTVPVWAASKVSLTVWPPPLHEID